MNEKLENYFYLLFYYIMATPKGINDGYIFL